MQINKDINKVTISDLKKEINIEKLKNDQINITFFSGKIDCVSDKSIEFTESDLLVYESVKQLFNDLTTEYYKYKNYFDKIHSDFLDENGQKRDIPLYNKTYNSFLIYSENGNFKNNSYIRIFRQNSKYYIYFNRPSMDFIISENDSKFNYNSLYQYFLKFYNNIKEEKRNKLYGKFKNFNNSI